MDTKYTVELSATLDLSRTIEVEAGNEAEAVNKAHDEFFEQLLAAKHRELLYEFNQHTDIDAHIVSRD